MHQGDRVQRTVTLLSRRKKRKREREKTTEEEPRSLHRALLIFGQLLGSICAQRDFCISIYKYICVNKNDFKKETQKYLLKNLYNIEQKYNDTIKVYTNIELLEGSIQYLQI